MKGIHRAAAQTELAALSINTSYASPYEDQETADGVLYAYRAGDVDQPDNRALRAASELAVPIVYFVGTRPGWYKPFYPCYVVSDDPTARQVLVTKGEMAGPLDDREPMLPEDPIERRYAVREMRVRVHQSRFRGRVIPAYGSQCTICRLKESRLLDAAHIISDAEVLGELSVTNGASSRSRRTTASQSAAGLLEDEDGPMLELLKGFHGMKIHLPQKRAQRPDQERLAVRYDQFVEASSA